MLAPNVAFGCRFKSRSTPLNASMAITRSGMLIQPSCPDPNQGPHLRRTDAFRHDPKPLTLDGRGPRLDRS